MEMSYVMYTNILAEIMKRQQFQSVSNLYGNAYALESAQEVIGESNPFKELFDDKGGNNDGMQRLTRGTLEQLSQIKNV